MSLIWRPFTDREPVPTAYPDNRAISHSVLDGELVPVHIQSIRAKKNGMAGLPRILPSAGHGIHLLTLYQYRGEDKHLSWPQDIGGR